MVVPDIVAIVVQQDLDLEGVNEMRRLASVCKCISVERVRPRSWPWGDRPSVVKPALSKGGKLRCSGEAGRRNGMREKA